MLTAGIAALFALTGCQEYSVDQLNQRIDDPLGVVLEVDPPDFRFTEACVDDEVVVSLINAGDETVVVDDIDFDAESGALRMSHRNPVPGPFEIAVDERAFVTIQHVPSRPVEVRGTLQIDSNDPRGVQEAILVAEAGSLERTDTFRPQDPPVDVLIAVDTTGSMSVLHESGVITDGLNGLVDDLSRVTDNWKVGVIWGGDPCTRGLVEPSSKTPAIDLGAAFPSPDAPENDRMFSMVEGALSETGQGGCNTSFLRPGSSLSVVVLSNSVPETTKWADIAQNWSSYVEDCRKLSVHALVNSEVYDGVIRPNPYIDAANATGGIVLNAPSETPWATKWSQVGNAVGQRVRPLLLSSVPDPDSIVVEVAGAAWATGWSFDSFLNAVRVTRPVPADDAVDVTYDIDRCLPSECTF